MAGDLRNLKSPGISRKEKNVLSERNHIRKSSGDCKKLYKGNGKKSTEGSESEKDTGTGTGREPEECSKESGQNIKLQLRGWGPVGDANLQEGPQTESGESKEGV